MADQPSPQMKFVDDYRLRRLRHVAKCLTEKRALESLRPYDGPGLGVEDAVEGFAHDLAYLISVAEAHERLLQEYVDRAMLEPSGRLLIFPDQPR